MNLPAEKIATQTQFPRAIEVLRDGIAALAFPGAAFAVTFNGRLIALHGVGRFTYEASSPQVMPETIYDVASLSKVIATSAMAMILYQRGRLSLQSHVADFLPEFATGHPGKRSVTIEMLLAHSSGLPAHAKLYALAQSREQALQVAMRLPLTAEPGTRAEYSDIGFILLGEILSRIAGEPIDSFSQREIFKPLNLQRTVFNPPADWKPLIPPTADHQNYRKRVIQGEVNDDNASILGGVAGQAGLFAAAQDVARFAECILRGGAPILKPETDAQFTRRQTAPAGTSRTLGWDTPSPPSQAGKYFSQESFGHLGYTGCSLWIDPRRRLSINLLTNRTWPNAESQEIKQVRPALHDAIVEGLNE